MSDLQLRVQIAAIDKITAPLRNIAKQSQRLSEGYKADMKGYNDTLRQTKAALKQVEDQNAALRKSGVPLIQSQIDQEQKYRQQLLETNRVIDLRNAKMDKEMGLVKRRQAAMDRGKEQMMRGTVMMASATGATYAGARLMMPGFDFEESMSEVQALTQLEKLDPLFTALQEQAEDLGASTWASATQAAEAQAFYAMAGYSPEAIMKVLPSTLDLAKAAKTDLGRTADITSNILSAFGLDPEETEDVADILVTAFTGSNTSLEKLGDTMAYVAPVAKDLGISLEESAAMAGILGNMGIQDSKAGTAMRKIYSSLAAPNSSGIKALQKLNIKTKDTAGNLREIPDIFADFLNMTKKLGTAERLEALTKVVGLEAATAFSILVDEKNIKDFDVMMDKMDVRQGITAKTSKTMSDNTKGDWENLTSAIEGIQIKISQAANAQIRDTITTITSILETINLWIKANPKLASGVMKTTMIIIGLVGAVGALSFAMGVFNMVVLANPIILLISTVVAALALLFIYKDEVWDFFKAFADAPRHYIHKTVRYMNGLLDSISEWVSQIPLVGPAAQLVFESLAFNLRIIYYLIGKITDAFAWIGKTWVTPTIDTSSIENTWDLIQVGLNFILDLRNNISDLIGKIPVIGPALQLIFDLFTFTFALVIQIVKEIVRMFEWIKNNATAIGGIFVAMWDSIVQAAQPVVKLFEWIMEMVGKISTGVADAFSFEMPGWMKSAGDLVGNTYDYFADSLSYSGNLVGNQMDAVFGRNNHVATIATTPAVPVNNRTTTNHQEVHVGGIHITSNASPQAIGGAVAAAIKKQSFIGDEY